MSERLAALAVSASGVVVRCACCARLQLEFGSVIVSFDDAVRLDSLAEAVEVLCADHPPWEARGSRLMIRLGRHVAFALHPEELHQLGDLLRSARAALDARTDDPADAPRLPREIRHRPWQAGESS